MLFSSFIRSKAPKSDDATILYFPMESCKILCSDGCLLLKASLLPSALHRLERLLVANILREEIACGIGLKDKSHGKKRKPICLLQNIKN